MAKKLRKGSAVRVLAGYELDGHPWPKQMMSGTVTQVGRHKARVLFPIRSFYWLPIKFLEVTGFDGDGSSVHWR